MVTSSSLRFKVLVAASAAIVVSVWLATRGGMALTAPLRAWVRPMAGAFASWAQARGRRQGDRESLVRERDALAGEVARLTSAVRDVAVCQEENDELKKLARYRAPPGFVTISARMVSYANAEKTQVRIDQGTASGVSEGAAAVSGEGMLWGRVTKTEPAYSVVSLLADPALAIPARAAGSASDGIVRRDEQGRLILDLLPLDATLNLDAPVLTTGLDERIPPRLVIGRVVRAERRAHVPFLHVEVAAVPLQPQAFLYVVVHRVAGQ